MVAAVGLYGVIAYSVAQRMHELGVRMALGARSGHIVRLVVAQGLGPAAAGSAIGLVIAGLASRWIEPLLYQESPWDPVTSGAVAAVMIAVGIVAGAVPAARALRADPNRALRVELDESTMLPELTKPTTNRALPAVSDDGGRPPVTLDAARIDDAPLLANLLELYLHDLSEIFPINPGADGRFGYERLPLYWSEPTRRFAYLIRSREEVAGFALVTRGSPATDDPENLDVAEFFVLRSNRRSGIGRRAAFLLWDRLPGRWVVRVSEKNRGGIPFWESAIREYTGGAFAA